MRAPVGARGDLPALARKPAHCAFEYALNMNNTDMNGLDAGSLNMGSFSMTSIVVSTIVYFVAAYFIKRHLVEMGIPKGPTRGMVVFIGAAAVSYGAAYLINLVVS